ncbi:DUF4097 family beta strand repeat-containing protein [Catenulispora pinisilvae]|uniref:DUF4097 family beta strand repeat-containing protein n=1 Tax=Catenulispora pinisilvae TaxID=2705253 RepID=UPI001891A1AA|nr:DUF4097 family beta strand repeat-containing protein [Catenulispora pinisilvae]
MTRHELKGPDRLAFEGIHRLKVVTTSGKVDVVGAGEDGAAVVDVTRVKGEEPLVVTAEDGELRVTHGDYRPNLLGWLMHTRKIEADISIQVPPDCLVDVTVISGPLVLSNLHERTRAHGVSGEITLAQVHGPTDVKTVSGAITAESVTDDLSALTVSGPITVIALGSQNTIKAGTTSGAITVDLEDGTDAPRLDLNVVSGQVIVRAPEDANLDVDMSTMSGRTVTTFDGLDSQALFQNKQIPFTKPRQLSGRLGTGRGRLRARAVSGDMTLLRRAVDHEVKNSVVDDEDGKDR